MHKFTLYLKVTARRLSNPVFFMLLGLSLILWYVTKLSHSYTADINIPVRIDSVYYSVRCQVEGSGYQILLHKIAPRKNGVFISSDNIAVTPSTTASGLYDISPFWLQNTISSQITDLKIKSVAAPVEIEFPKRKRRLRSAITGGIGSGSESTGLPPHFVAGGFPVYDSGHRSRGG